MATSGRSETKAVGNSKFTDLNLTRYPAQIDSKDDTNPSYNENMKGFWSAGDTRLPAGTDPDYNMAEHVNALADAVMAIQRILGVNPHVDYQGGNTTGTVNTRISAAENKDGYYDARYGGVNWNTSLGQTILSHTHGGGTNQAPQIDLVTDIKGILKKDNIDLTQGTGITGANLSISPSISTKISDAINDKLSISQGGVVKKDLEVQGRVTSRTYKEWTSKNIVTGASITDIKTLENAARRYVGTAGDVIIAESVKNLLCGKYVLGVRVRVNSLVGDDVLTLSFYEYFQSSGTRITKGTTSIKGTDFETINTWKMFYLVFDHETVDTAGYNSLTILKTETPTDITLDFDCAWIMPTHPAVFDK